MDRRIAAIRADHLVGTGTSSPIDECWDDEMILDRLNEQGIRTARDAVRWARRLHAAVTAAWDDVAATAW